MIRKKKDTKQWYDVHFSLNGFMKINANNDQDAYEKANDILKEHNGQIEGAIGTSVGIEINDIIGEDDE